MENQHSNQRRHLVILGTGFAAVMILKRINLKLYDVTVVSPRNHFLFTPLLPSTTVGTVEFRSIIEPIRKTRQGIHYVQAECTAIAPEKQTVTCSGVETDETFTLEYDELAITVGAENNTFGVPGVEEHAHFLKELVDARDIRERIISCLERADVPGINPQERARLLHFMIVGGGPTGVEFAAELHDLVEEALDVNYPQLVGLVKITLYEALPTILNSFDQELRDYTIRHFNRQGINLELEQTVSRVGPGYLEFDNGEREEGGVIVWSTGYSPTSLVAGLPFDNARGRVITDEYLRVPSYANIYALGDCATIAGQNLPQTAQVAMQEGKYLGATLNKKAKGKEYRPFKYNNLGMLAYIGEKKALADIPKARLHWRGFLTYFFWRSAYITRLVSLKNKVLVLFDWIKTRTFGRDMSKF